MWEGCYGKEPFDFRLTVLRLFSQLDKILTVTLIGTLLFGGGYYVKNVLFGTHVQYQATSTYRVDYVVEEEKDVGTVYINQASWNTYVHAQEFLDAVQVHYKEQAAGGYQPEELSKEELTEALQAFLASDLRVPSTTVTTDTAEKSLRIAKAVEQTMTEDFPQGIREIAEIRVIDEADSAQAVKPDVRPVRAFVLSAVLTGFFAVILFLLKETGDDNLWLPATIRQRYGLKVVGTLESPQLLENISYSFQGKEKTAVCALQKQVNPLGVLAALQEKGVKGTEQWFAVPSPVLCPEGCEKLREADGILLAVAAGAHAGKQLEYCLEYFKEQDCNITAVILTDADEKLIKTYYFGRKSL